MLTLNRKLTKLPTLIAVLLLSGVANADVHNINKFKCSFNLADAQQSRRSVTLTKETYACFNYDGYNDIAVVNGAQQVVPFRFSKLTNKSHYEDSFRSYEFHQEPALAYKTDEQIRRIKALTGITSSATTALEWDKTNSHYSSATQAAVLIEGSDDLQSWTGLSFTNNLYFLKNNQSLNSDGLMGLVKLHSTRKVRYLRVVALSNQAQFTSSIGQINGRYQHLKQPIPARHWSTPKIVKDQNQANAWIIETPYLAPFSAIRLKHADDIVYYHGSLYAQAHTNPTRQQQGLRGSGKEKLKKIIKKASQKQSPNWRYVTKFEQYKLINDDAFLLSDTTTFRDTKSRRWKVVFHTPSDMQEQQTPVIQLGWLPSKVEFVANGVGPFSLLIGNSVATPKTTYPPVIVGSAAFTSNGQHDTEIPNIVIAPVAIEGSNQNNNTLASANPGNAQQDNATLSNTAETQVKSWHKVLLWAILLLGVGIMLSMAYRLISKMNEQK